MTGRQSFLNEAISIAEILVEQAIHGTDGSICWIQRAWSRELQADPPVADLQAMGNDLYAGTPGIALFFAGLERAAPGSGMLPFALGAIQPLIADLLANGDDVADIYGIGGLFGIGSAIYVLTCISDLLGRSDLIEHAERAARLISDKRLAADVALDVTQGSAGALLGLLALYDATGSPLALERALKCGENLLARMEPAGGNLRAIRTLEGRFLSGFSHGTAGIAYSLCRLYKASGEAKFLAVARELIAFERASYSAVDGNWPDLRHPGSSRFMPSWCHGGPGIALARVASLDVIDDVLTRNEIDRALSITRESLNTGADYLCCGKFGSINSLWTVGSVLGREELCAQAESAALRSASDAKSNGGYPAAVAPVGRFKCLGLFQGLAGFGYTFLRLALADRIPDILVFGRPL